jgi:hypothetical protein
MQGRGSKSYLVVIPFRRQIDRVNGKLRHGSNGMSPLIILISSFQSPLQLLKAVGCVAFSPCNK